MPFDAAALDTASFDAVELEPGLDQLVRALTAAPAPDELAGEAAALAMFRARTPGAALGAQGPPPARPSLRSWLSRRSGLTAAAVVLALAGSTAAAAYAAALPSAVQHVAHRLLNRIGVPDTPGAHSAAVPPVAARSGRPPASHAAGTATPGTPAPGRRGSPSPSPVPSGTFQVLLIVTQRRLPAEGSETFLAQLTLVSGQAPVAGQEIQLLEQPAGSAGWTVAGQAVTGSRGSAVLIARELTRNAVFEVAGPGGARSEPVRVVVVPLVTVSVSGAGSGGGTGQEAVTVTASVAFGSPGDVVVLQRLTVSGWDAVREQALGGNGEAAFVLKGVAAEGGRAYRAVVLATAVHGAGVSSPVRV
jgi:hypothetical protein